MNVEFSSERPLNTNFMHLFPAVVGTAMIPKDTSTISPTLNAVYGTLVYLIQISNASLMPGIDSLIDFGRLHMLV